jgi:hypothetical protein
MKINISPEMVTSEMQVKLKKPSLPGVTYRAEAEIKEVSPPKVVIEGKIVTLGGEVVAEARAVCVMMDKLASMTGAAAASFPMDADAADDHSLAADVATDSSLTRRQGSATGLPPAPPGGASAAPTAATAGGGGIKETVEEMRALQRRLVTLMQNEYFCDDIEPPTEAFGWEEARLRDYFENGGE